jgi:hypothetical protein
MWWPVHERPRGNKYVVCQTAHVPAPSEAVYAVLANYLEGHPRILPKHFTNLVVEEGGIGAGTVIRFQMHTLGQRRELRAAVSEPEPGRVLQERSLQADGAVTTFTVHPIDSGASAQVVITTELTRRTGPIAAIERAMTSAMLRSIYRKELNLLRTHVGTRQRA